MITLALAMAAIAVYAQYLEPKIDSQSNPDIQIVTHDNNYATGETQFSVNSAATPDSNQSMMLAPVPEPTPYLMFGLGALVLAFGRWRALRSRGPRL